MTKLLDTKTREKLINYLNSRFGIEKDFFRDYLFTISGHSVSIISQSRETRKIIEQLLYRNYVNGFGIELFSNFKDYTPSSLGFGLFKAGEIMHNSVTFSREQANDYFKGKDISSKDAIKINTLSSGYIICIFNSQIIGTANFDKQSQMIKPNLSFVNTKIK
ncbi:MAG: hypothetical protein WCX82_04505 [archaeon]|jgi:NOL1/NOP2/fmu family ribosome biogenesis protein